ncbi:MAG: cobalt transport protein, partial [Nocardioides sp.]|nr:cobalt transport protein [Nocardioides sp.]
GLCGVCVGVYAVLDRTAPRYLALPMLLGGVLVAVAGLMSAGRRVERTRYRPDPWRWPELAVVGSGLAVGAVGWWVGGHQILVAYPDLTSFPRVSAQAMLGACAGLAAAVCAPEPVLQARSVPA